MGPGPGARVALLINDGDDGVYTDLAWVHHWTPVMLGEAAQRVWTDPAADLGDCKALLGRGPREDEVRVERVE